MQAANVFRERNWNLSLGNLSLGNLSLGWNLKQNSGQRPISHLAGTLNSVYVTGDTEGGLDGNPSFGGFDMYLVKYNGAGTKERTKQLGTSDFDLGHGAATDSSGNVYVTSM